MGIEFEREVYKVDFSMIDFRRKQLETKRKGFATISWLRRFPSRGYVNGWFLFPNTYVWSFLVFPIFVTLYLFIEWFKLF